MADATLPTFSQTIDDFFVDSWYELKKEAIDNILDATPTMAALKMKGCLTPQVGGSKIVRRIRHGVVESQEIDKSSILNHGEDEIETAAMWDWAYISAHVQYSLIDVQQNSGPAKLKDLVSVKLQAARDSLVEKQESAAWDDLDDVASFSNGDALRKGVSMNNIREILPGHSGLADKSGIDYYDKHPDTYASYGGIARGQAVKSTHDFWAAKYKDDTGAKEIYLLSDMRNLWNSCGSNMSYPTLIVSNQTIFETYEEYAIDAAQIVKNVGGLADLGFETMKFKGADWIWSPGVEDNDVYMLNTNFIEVVYDPNMWFDMLPWKNIPYQPNRITHILCAQNIICTQLRRQGFLGTYS